jgi:biotin carboxylase
MTQTIIFLNLRLPAECELPTLVDNNRFRFVAIYSAKEADHLASNIKECFDQLYIVEQKQEPSIIKAQHFDDASLHNIIQKELAKVDGDPKRLRFVSNDEFNLVVVGKLRDQYNISGPGEKLLLGYRDKNIMKTRLEKAGITLPKHEPLDFNLADDSLSEYFSQLAKQYQFPLVIKPSRGAGSIDTHIINDLEKLKYYYSKIKLMDCDFEINQFIDGTLYHCDTVIQNNNILLQVISEYLYPNITYATEGKPVTSILLLDDNPLKKQIATLTEQVLQTLGKHDGVTHLEVFHTKDNRLIFLEIAARPPGGLMAANYQIMYGINVFKMHLQIELDINLPSFSSTPKIYPKRLEIRCMSTRLLLHLERFSITKMLI